MAGFRLPEPVLGPDGKPARDAQGAPLYRYKEIWLPRAYIDHVLRQKDRRISVNLDGKEALLDLARVTPEMLDGRAGAPPPVSLAKLKADLAAVQQEREHERQNRLKSLEPMAPEDKLREIESWRYDRIFFFNELEPLRRSILEEMKGSGERASVLDAPRSNGRARTQRTVGGARSSSLVSSSRKVKRATARTRRVRK